MTLVWESVIFSLIGLAILFLFVYCMILFIKFAHRAIRALDLYIRHAEANVHKSDD